MEPQQQYQPEVPQIPPAASGPDPVQADSKDSSQRSILIWGPIIAALAGIVLQIIVSAASSTGDFMGAGLGLLYIPGPLGNLFLVALTVIFWRMQINYIRRNFSNNRLEQLSGKLLGSLVTVMLLAVVAAFVVFISSGSIAENGLGDVLIILPVSVTMIGAVALFLFLFSLYNSVYIATNGSSNAVRITGKVLYALAWPVIFIFGFISYVITYLFLDPPDEG